MCKHGFLGRAARVFGHEEVSGEEELALGAARESGKPEERRGTQVWGSRTVVSASSASRESLSQSIVVDGVAHRPPRSRPEGFVPPTAGTVDAGPPLVAAVLPAQPAALS